MIKKNIATLQQNLKASLSGSQPPSDKLMVLLKARKRLQLVDAQLEHIVKGLEKSQQELQSCEYDTKLLNRIIYAFQKVRKGIQTEISRMSG